MPSHAEASALIRDGAALYLERDPTEAEVQAAQAVAWIETNYGRGWKESGVGSHNWGAITCKNCDGFLHGDSDPDTGKYITTFRIYPDDAAGAADVAREVLRRAPVLEAAARGDLRGVSEGLYDTNYYRGTGPDKETRVSRHYSALQNAVDAITSSTGQPSAFRNVSTPAAPGVPDLIDPFDPFALEASRASARARSVVPAAIALGILALTLRARRSS